MIDRTGSSTTRSRWARQRDEDEKWRIPEGGLFRTHCGSSPRPPHQPCITASAPRVLNFGLTRALPRSVVAAHRALGFDEAPCISEELGRW